MQEWKTLSKIFEPHISNTFNLSNESPFLNCTTPINRSLFPTKKKALWPSVGCWLRKRWQGASSGCEPTFGLGSVDRHVCSSWGKTSSLNSTWCHMWCPRDIQVSYLRHWTGSASPMGFLAKVQTWIYSGVNTRQKVRNLLQNPRLSLPKCPSHEMQRKTNLLQITGLRGDDNK